MDLKSGNFVGTERYGRQLFTVCFQRRQQLENELFIILLFPFSLSFLLTKMPKLHFRVHEIVLPTHLILTLPTLSFFSHHILSFWPVLSKTIVFLYQKNIEFLFIIHRVFFFLIKTSSIFYIVTKWVNE